MSAAESKKKGEKNVYRTSVKRIMTSPKEEIAAMKGILQEVNVLLMLLIGN